MGSKDKYYLEYKGKMLNDDLSYDDCIMEYVFQQGVEGRDPEHFHFINQKTGITYTLELVPKEVKEDATSNPNTPAKPISFLGIETTEEE
jgi:hypothetical protein